MRGNGIEKYTSGTVHDIPRSRRVISDFLSDEVIDCGLALVEVLVSVQD